MRPTGMGGFCAERVLTARSQWRARTVADSFRPLFFDRELLKGAPGHMTTMTANSRDHVIFKAVVYTAWSFLATDKPIIKLNCR